MASLKTLALKAAIANETNLNCLKPSTFSILSCLELVDDVDLSKFILSRQIEGFDPFNDIAKTIGEICPPDCTYERRRLIMVKSFYTGSYMVIATLCNKHTSLFFPSILLNPSISIDRNVFPMCLSVPLYFYKNGTTNADISYIPEMPTRQFCNQSTYLSLEPLNLSSIKERFVMGFDTRDLIWITTPLNTELVVTPCIQDTWLIEDIDVWISNCQGL